MTFAPSLPQRHFEPASQLWQVNREMALLLAGVGMLLKGLLS